MLRNTTSLKSHNVLYGKVFGFITENEALLGEVYERRTMIGQLKCIY